MNSFFDLAPHSEDFLRRVIASSPDCIKVLDLEGNLVAMSEGGQDILEITDLTPHLHTCWTGWWKGEAQEDAIKAVEAAKRGGTGRFEAFAKTFGGTPKWWDVTVSPILGANGQPEKLLSVSRDITAGKEAAAKVAESEGRLRAILESVLDYAIFTMDTAGLVTSWNIGPKRLFGYDNAEIIGSQAAVLWTPEDQKAGIPAAEMATAKQKGWADDIRWHQRRDGTCFYAVGAMRPLRDEAGALSGFTKVCRDVTAKHQAEQDLARSRAQIAAAADAERARLAEVFHRSPSFMAVLRGPQHVFELVNERYLQLIGHRDVLQKTVAEALPEVAGQGFLELLDRVYATGEPFVGKDVRFLVERQPGHPREERFLELIYQPTFATDGSISGILAHGMDLTERKKAGLALAQVAEQRRLALDSAQMGSWHFDLASGRIHWDARFKAIFGVADEELSYERVVSLLHPADRENVREAIAAASRPNDPVPYSIEYRVVHPDGSEHWVEAHGRTYFEGEGQMRRAISLVGTVREITAEKLAHEALRQSEAKYRSLFDSIDQAFCVLEVIWDARDRPVDYRVIEVNRAMEKHTGWHEPVGRTARELIPNLEDHWLEIYGRVTRTGEPIRFVEGAEGMGRVFDAYAFRIGSAEHPQVGVIFQDITERRRTEAELARLSEQRRIALDSAQLGWWHNDLVTGQVEWDERSRELYGHSTRQHTFEEVMTMIHPEDLPARTVAYEAALDPNDPRPYFIEYRVTAADGSMRWLQIKGRATFAGEGAARRAVSMDGTVADVTANKAAQAALHESEAKFRQLADVMPQIVWAAGPDGVLNYTNRRWYEFIQKSEGEFFPADWGERVHPDDLPGAVALWSGCLASGDPYTTEFRIEDGDGKYHWFLVRALPVRAENGTITRWYGTCTDIDTQRAMLEQNAQLLESERSARSEAERTSQMKDEFLATLSHELRTPLNAILGWTQVLRDDPANTEDINAGLLTIERNARAQTQIIEDLLDMSKIISGKVRLDVQRLDLDQVVAASVETMRPAATAKGIRLQALIDPQARMISGDPNRLQQVFWNLLSNAIKFTPKGGKVQVILERVNSHLEVSVSDSGEGIASEFLPQVFGRFQQADASTTRKHGGLGLGLAIVKQLVELHGGSIQAESAGLGQGATFRVALPLSAAQPVPGASEPERQHPQAGGTFIAIPSDLLHLSGVKVLVVDDEADARELVKRLLVDREAIVETADSVAAALELVQSQRPDVLVSDIGMPGEDGYALIRKVRSLPPEKGGNTPAVALTAYARPEDRFKVILAGFQMHLAKPVEAAELLAQVASLAGRVAKP